VADVSRRQRRQAGRFGVWLHRTAGDTSFATQALSVEIGVLLALGLVLTLCVAGRRRWLKNEQRRDALERVRYFARRSH